VSIHAIHCAVSAIDTAPQKGSLLRAEHLRLPQKGSLLRAEHLRLPQKGSLLHAEHLRLPQKGSLLRAEHLRVTGRQARHGALGSAYPCDVSCQRLCSMYLQQPSANIT
jgi:hypothetical protein